MRRGAGAAVAALALAACGTPSADLFVIRRSGAIPGARLSLLVSDGGTVRCNGTEPRMLGDAQLLEARELARDLAAPARRRLMLAPGRGSILTYVVRVEDGRVRFSDTSRGQPAVLRRLAYFTRRVARDVCGLAR
jgi:hypothetical protein